MAASLQNANPMVFKAKQERIILPEEEDDSVVDKIDEREVFDILFSVFIITQLFWEYNDMSERAPTCPTNVSKNVNPRTQSSEFYPSQS